MTPAEAAAKLELTYAPVAVAFLAEPPPGVPHVAASLAAGCAYWTHASEGRAFYTTSEDHFGCPVGAHTHGVAVPADRNGELQSVVGTMLSLEYLREREVPEIPTRDAPFGVAVYAPLGLATFEPQLVIVRGSPRQLMVLSEAARAADAFDNSPPMGRPACAMLPQVDKTGHGVMSIGCIGNRVYTGLGDGELYVTLPAALLPEVVTKLDTIAHANRALEQFHTERRDARRAALGSA